MSDTENRSTVPAPKVSGQGTVTPPADVRELDPATAAGDRGDGGSGQPGGAVPAGTLQQTAEAERNAQAAEEAGKAEES